MAHEARQGPGIGIAVSASAAVPSPVPVSREFVDSLLAAITEMAVLSPRRQADVAVAMRRANLGAAPEMLARAVDQLYREGCIERPLHLSDGGILASVTMRGIEFLSTTPHRHIVVRMMGSAAR